jgi:uncharacterized protein
MKKYIIIITLSLLSILSIGQTDSSEKKLVQFFFDNGNISSEGYLRNNKPDGYWRTYFEDGTIKSEGNRENFQLHGVWKFYNADGTIQLEINYKEGMKHGKRTQYIENGKIIENFENDIKEGYTYHFLQMIKSRRRYFLKAD